MLTMAAESYPGPGVSPGRVDQYLYPYYQADLESGRLTREQAKEWLECWWIKHNSKSIQGLYLTGSSTHPGGGVPSVIGSGVIAARLIEQCEP